MNKLLEKIHKKSWGYIAGILWCSTLLSSCGKDNYEAPTAQLKGRIVYQGEAIPVSYNDVVFELFEPGWQLQNPITVTVDQDGSYAAMLFNASYKAFFQPNQGPFIAPADSLAIEVNGNTEFDIEVLPYFMLRNPSFTANDRNVQATFQVEKIINDERARNIEHITLYVGKTLFTDGRTAVASSRMDGGTVDISQTINLNVDVPFLTPTQNYIFARVGLKIVGVEDMVFTPVQRLEL
ncbi:DUF3823 domain-containing protein [Olivibacter sitiensis]|uniref:DUF3823 domain-containing protein n=1 Tax=Olivibacter sitiensis TaxID=376470 RepID=UPI000402D9D5|nr:DUF3823 domain-containing protein [Olivibacter sitiensis]